MNLGISMVLFFGISFDSAQAFADQARQVFIGLCRVIIGRDLEPVLVHIFRIDINFNVVLMQSEQQLFVYFYVFQVNGQDWGGVVAPEIHRPFQAIIYKLGIGVHPFNDL